MAVKIKLARYGKIREPFYRVVVADARTRRSGRAIETIGRYNPKTEPSVIQIDSERALYWLGVGAQATEAVVALFKVTGDWQKFKGLPGTEGTLKPQPERVNKKALYEAAIAAAGGVVDDTSGATTAKKKPAKKSDDAKPGDAKAADAKPADAKPEETTADRSKSGAPAAASADVIATPAKSDAKDQDSSDQPSFGDGSHAPIADDAQPDGFPIKGNASSKLYHRPDSQFYDSTVAEVWFATEEAAEKAGFSLPKSQHGDQ